MNLPPVFLDEEFKRSHLPGHDLKVGHHVPVEPGQKAQILLTKSSFYVYCLSLKTNPLMKRSGVVKATFIESMKKQLLKMKEDLLAHITEDVRTESDSSKFEIGDIYDQASSERERELHLILGDRDREKLKEIDEALHRIEEGSYGMCEECGEPIEEGRLKAMPFTKVCIDCKTRDEREHGKKKVYGGQEFIGRPDMAEFEEEE